MKINLDMICLLIYSYVHIWHVYCTLSFQKRMFMLEHTKNEYYRMCMGSECYINVVWFYTGNVVWFNTDS